MKDVKQGKPIMPLGEVYQISSILKCHLFKIVHYFIYSKNNNNHRQRNVFMTCNFSYTY